MTRSAPPVLDRALSAHEADPTARSGAHLADYPFRLGPPAAPPTPPRPTGPGTDWTLAETLAELRLRSAHVAVSTMGLRLRHAHRMPEVDAAVRTHAPAIRQWLDLGRPAPEAGWDDETALHAAWLRAHFSSPSTPVALRPGVTVTDWPTYVETLYAALAEGPRGPLADATRRDLAVLFGRYAQFVQRPVRRRARKLAA